MEMDDLLDAVLGIPKTLTVAYDMRSTQPVGTGRHRFGGYVPYTRPETQLIILEGSRSFEAKRSDLWKSTDRMRLRAADKRDTKIKKAKKQAHDV